jgi:hypothetical protein
MASVSNVPALRYILRSAVRLAGRWHAATSLLQPETPKLLGRNDIDEMGAFSGLETFRTTAGEGVLLVPESASTNVPRLARWRRAQGVARARLGEAGRTRQARRAQAPGTHEYPRRREERDDRSQPARLLSAIAPHASEFSQPAGGPTAMRAVSERTVVEISLQPGAGQTDWTGLVVFARARSAPLSMSSTTTSSPRSR